MALSDRLGNPPEAAPWRTCSICWLLGRVDDDDRAALEFALAHDRKWPGRALEAELREEYHVVIGVDSVGKHRRAHMGRP